MRRHRRLFVVVDKIGEERQRSLSFFESRALIRKLASESRSNSRIKSNALQNGFVLE